ASRWIPLAGLSRSNGWYILPSDPLVALPDQWLPPIRGSSIGYANCSPKPPQRRPGAGVSADSLLMLPKGAVPSVPDWARLKSSTGAQQAFADDDAVLRTCEALTASGLGYSALAPRATELTGGEAQRVTLATELQRTTNNHTPYILDEPSAGLDPADVARLNA